jgi:hypothetical protein
MKHSNFTSHISNRIGLVGFCLVVNFLIITPVMAEILILSTDFKGISDQSTVKQAPLYEAGSINITPSNGDENSVVKQTTVQVNGAEPILITSDNTDNDSVIVQM